MPATAEPKTKPVRLDLSPEDHELLRIEAFKTRLSMAAFSREAFGFLLRDKEFLERFRRDRAKKGS